MGPTPRGFFCQWLRLLRMRELCGAHSPVSSYRHPFLGPRGIDPGFAYNAGQARERYAQFVLPTLMTPDEVWATAYDDGTKRRRFIKLFTGGKYDIATLVMQNPNGSILWNVIIRERKGMNNLRVGALEYAAE